MRTVRTVRELRAATGPARSEGDGPIGLVPTMGALHAGHASLIEAARRRCGTVVVSIFVNPTQFDDASDLARYPRQERRDAEAARAAGADLLFAPSAAEIYPQGFATSVQVGGGLTERLEGACRGASHFHGVTTVVCKLLNIARPDVAFFGRKDAQQAAVICRMARDLNMGVEIVTLPTVREPDGLALSSRNARLSPAERERALALHTALSAAEREVAAGESDGRRLRELTVAEMARFDVQPEYVEIVDAETFEPLRSLRDGGLLLVAARIGRTRLIDNVQLSRPARTGADAPPGAGTGERAEQRRRSAGEQEKTQEERGDVIAVCSA